MSFWDGFEKTAISRSIIIKAIKRRATVNGNMPVANEAIRNIMNAYNEHASPKDMKRLLKDSVKHVQKKIPKSFKGIESFNKAKALRLKTDSAQLKLPIKDDRL